MLRSAASSFTVKVGTVFEASHIQLHIWLQAVALLTASKKGMSSNQLHRTLGVTLKTAWFMSHRIREAMRDGALPRWAVPARSSRRTKPISAKPKSRTPRCHRQRSPLHQARPLAREQARHRFACRARRQGSLVPCRERRQGNRANIVTENIASEARLHTDESRLYTGADVHGLLAHETVKHSAKEYVRGDVHTNSVEGYFSIFKRGMNGVYQHCAEKHLHRYLAEFDFRYNNRIALGVNDH